MARAAGGIRADHPGCGVPRPEGRAPTSRSRRAILRATRTASTRSWPTPTAPSRLVRPTPWMACRPSPTVRGRSGSPTPSCARRPATGGRTWSRTRRVGRRCDVKLGFLTACLPRRSLAEICAVGLGPRLRGARGGGLAGPGRPTVHRDPPERRRIRRAGGRCRPGAVRASTASSARRWRTTTTTSIPIPTRAPRSTSTSTSASTLRRGSAARPSARSSAATRAARWPRTSGARRRCSGRSSTTPARPGSSSSSRTA